MSARARSLAGSLALSHAGSLAPSLAPEPWRRRGACPSLLHPMPTGDGLLARLTPEAGELSAAQLAGVARAALAYGNGLVEITARASLQIRGLTAASAPAFAEAIAALGIRMREGLPVETGPLAGLDASAVVDAVPLAQELRRRAAAAGLPERLGPKVSVAIDDGGALPPGAAGADVHLSALATPGTGVRWRLRTASRRRDGLDAEHALSRTLAVLASIAEKGRQARARDLGEADLAAIDGGFVRAAADADRRPPPVGAFPLAGGLHAHGIALPFGRTHAESLLAVANAADAATPVRLAPAGLLVIGLPSASVGCWLNAARENHLITAPGDPRLSIHACAGAPACGAAHLDTHALAGALAGLPEIAGAGVHVHLFGCGKQCARPLAPAVTLTGRADGCDVAAHGVRLSGGIEAALTRIARFHISKASA